MPIQEVSTLFSEALELPEPARRQYLEETTGHNRETIEEVERLLAAHAASQTFFSRLETTVQPGLETHPIAACGELVAARFRIVRFIASGASGEVYEAYDQDLNVRIALKLLRAQLVESPAALERFRDEIRIARGVNHPNVCRIFDLGSRTGAGGEPTLFYTMELLEGETVAARVRREGALPAPDVLDIARQMAAGIGAIHGAGVLHRDISSGNIMLCVAADGRVRTVLMDFGLAVRSELLTETERGIRGGTLSYAAPEQFAGAIPSVESDVYAFGAVLYQLMTGQPPAGLPPAPPSKLREGLPGCWDSTILRCLEARASDRFETIAEAAKSLEEPKRISRRWIAAGVIAAVAATALGTRLLPGRTTIARQSIAVAQFTSSTDDLRYLATGITSRLIDTLTTVPGLRVVGSAVHDEKLLADFSGLEQRAQTRNVLRGEVTRNGDGYNVRVHLTDLETHYDLWSQSFQVDDRSLERIDAPVAQAVIAALDVPHTEASNQAGGKPMIPSPEAYQAYLLGSYYESVRDKESLERAVASYRHAVDLDPYFARGFAALAGALSLAANKTLVPDREKADESTRAAHRALALDPNLAEAEAVLGTNEHHFNWNWDEAEKHLRRAVRFNASSIVAHQWYAQLLSVVGRQDEALREIRLARNLDPLSSALAVGEAVILNRAGRYNDAIDALTWQIDTHPDFVNAYDILAEAYADAGSWDKALTTIGRGVALTNGASFMVAARGYYRGRLGRYTEAQADLTDITQRAAGGNAAPTEVAEVYSGLRDADAMFYWLGRGYDQHDIDVTLIMVDPVNAWVRSDRRFHELARKLRLPGENN
jgi:serine/threonine protein kinase/Flp pilus assembly protein TadD